MKLKLTIDGKPYEVEVEIEEEQAARPYAPAAVDVLFGGAHGAAARDGGRERRRLDSRR